MAALAAIFQNGRQNIQSISKFEIKFTNMSSDISNPTILLMLNLFLASKWVLEQYGGLGGHFKKWPPKNSDYFKILNKIFKHGK